jgi:hypothetical protein
VLRAALLSALLAASAVPAWAAHSEALPIVIAPFRNRCFDASQLAQRVRAQLPEAEVSVGAPPGGADQLVRVSGDGAEVTVRVSLRNARHQIVGSDERLLPLGDDCPSAAETAALIVVRAATPLLFRLPPALPAPHPPKPRPPGPLPPKPVEEHPPEPSEIRTAPPSPSPAPVQPPSENRTRLPSEMRTSENRTKPPSEGRTPPKVVSEMRTAPAPRRKAHRLEIDVAAMWTFPFDGPPSTPAGELTVGWRWPLGRIVHLGLGARAGVSEEWRATTSSVAGTIRLSARRIPVSAELRLDLEVPKGSGVIRLALGPQAAIWVAESTGLPRPGSALFAQPAAFARVAYRLELGPVVLQAGLDVDVAFVRDDLDVGGVGRVAQTPLVLLAPFAGAGVGFF